MPIQTIHNAQPVPIIGKIRLGIRKQSASGSDYPSTVEHFVLTDAPDVEKVYGPDPKELDIMFPSDDLEAIVPTWLKWYAGGVRGKDGSMIGGRLQCYGDGPDAEGKPGTAHYLLKRDPITRVVPTRPCAGALCPDYKSASGVQQCKQSMRVFCMLPLVSWYGVYQIDTTSWNSIHSFATQIRWVKDLNNGVVRMIPFKIVREEKTTNYLDPKTGKEKSGRQYIMMLKPNEVFLEKHGDNMKQKVALAFQASQRYLLPSREETLEAPMEDHFPATEVEVLPAITAVATAETLVEDADISAAFDSLEKATGKAYAKKARIIAIRKKEGAADLKQAVLDQINQMMKEHEQKPLAPVTDGGII